MRRSDDFRSAVKSGRRAGRPSLVLHLAVPLSAAPEQPATVGFVVSRQVGPAVVRNRVRRRLRHLMADRMTRLAPGSKAVVRANPAAADATFRTLAADLDAAFTRVGGSRGSRGSGGSR